MKLDPTFGRIVWSALLFAGAMAWGETAPLTTLGSVHSLTNAEASRSLPVSFPGVVTYYVRGNVDLFVQNGRAAIYVETTADQTFSPGDKVLVVGTTRASFRPEVKADRVILQGHGLPPAPEPAEFRQLIRAELDCQRATVRGFVRSANIIDDQGNATLYLQLQMKGGTVDAQMPADRRIDLPSLLDAEVEISGAVAGRFDRKLQMTGVLIEAVPSLCPRDSVRAPK